MEIEIDESSPVPLYQQIHDRIVEGIADGRLRTGESLVPVRKLAVAFGINPATVVKAYDLLKRDGLVQAHRKAGSVVVADPATARPTEEFVDGWSDRVRTLVAEAVVRGCRPDEVLDHCRSALAGLGHPARGAEAAR